MGYTHYWERPQCLSAARFNRTVADCRRLLPQLSVSLAGSNGTGTPCLDSEAIVFNGVGPDSYETFAIRRQETACEVGQPVVSFCKTEHKPYDLAVQAALIVFKHHFGSQFRVDSDGKEADWDAARQLCQQRLGYGGRFRLDKN